MLEKVETLRRKCAVCGRELIIRVHEDGTYEGGHYFGKISIPMGRMVKIGEEYIPGIGKVEIVEFEDYEEMEYWECDDCFNS